MSGFGGYLTANPGGPRAEALEAMLEPLRRGGGLEEALCLVARGRDSVWSVRAGRGDGGVVRASLRGPRDPGVSLSHDLALLHVPSTLDDSRIEPGQPYIAPEGDLVLVFDGEVFNQGEIRLELERRGTRLRSSTFVELLAAALRAWGDSAWERLNGSWAAAVYQRNSRTLVLCRDRLGDRPLYFAGEENTVLFGTSVLGVARGRPGGASVNGPRVRGFIDTGLKDFDDQTLFEGVFSVPSGTILTYRLEAGGGMEPRRRRYWNLPTERWRERDIALPEATALFRDLLRAAVECRLPGSGTVAFQLSSGLDSSSVLAVSASFTRGPLPTYTVSVPERNEEPLTRLMERCLPLGRRVLRGIEDGLLERGVELARWMEEPVQSPGALTHLRMCEEMGRDGFEVVLSGSGGDEILAGYHWDFWPAARTELIREGRWVPALLHHLALRYGSMHRAADALGGWVRWAGRLPGRVSGRSTRTGARTPGGSGASKGSEMPGGEGNRKPLSDAAAVREHFLALDYDSRRRFLFQQAELPYFLASNYRATQGVPILHRQPFLDHRLVELGLRLPVGYLFRNGWTKFVLRKAMDPLVPREILWRKEKTGFPGHALRLLADRLPALAPTLELVRDVGLLGEEEYPPGPLLGQDPHRLWRAWSVGSWLEALG